MFAFVTATVFGTAITAAGLILSAFLDFSRRSKLSDSQVAKIAVAISTALSAFGFLLVFGLLWGPTVGITSLLGSLIGSGIVVWLCRKQLFQ